MSDANIVTKNRIRLAPAAAIRWIRASIESFVKVVPMSKRISVASLQWDISVDDRALTCHWVAKPEDKRTLPVG